MRVYVHRGRDPQQIARILHWLRLNYGDLVKVTSPSTVELHRLSYDMGIPGVLVVYFRDDRDYSMFLLKWV